MNKKLAISALLCVILGTCTALSQSDWRTPGQKSLSNCPKAKDLRDETFFLCDSLRQGRARMSRGHADAAFYIASRLRALGCTPVNGEYSHSFMVSDSTDLGHNILGVMHASASASARYIVVGAHYDGLGIIEGEMYPGADANAAGVGVMLQIAQAFHKQLLDGLKYNFNILFVAFDSYLDGREGSRRLWQAIARGRITDSANGRRIRPENIALMIDLDQVGSNLAPVHQDRPDYIMAIGEQTLPSAARGILDRCNKFYGLGLDVCKSYYGSAGFTDAFYKLGDRKHFIRAGIPTMYFTSGIAPTTNKPSDTPESLDYDVLEKRATLIFRFIEKYPAL